MRYPTYRWLIVGLLFLATIINYMNRTALGLLAKPIGAAFNWSADLATANFFKLNAAFLVSYTVMYLLAGRMIDRFGIRVGITVCVAVWSVGSICMGMATGFWTMALFIVILGVGEPGIFPGGIKACAEWFPKKNRALPTGIFSAGASIGSVIMPLIIGTLASGSWRTAFYILGGLGFVWLVIFLKFYRAPAQLASITKAELDGINDTGTVPPAPAQNTSAAVAAPKESWGALLTQRKVLGLVFSRFLSDPVWHLYMLGLPIFFSTKWNLNLKELNVLWIVYACAAVGNILGGNFSDALVRRGWTSVRARFAILVVVGCIAPLGALLCLVPNMWTAIAIASVIAFICQMWSTNTATLVSDITNRSATASVMGMMGAAGSLVGAFFFFFVSGIVQKSFAPVFILAASFHPIAVIALFFFLRPVLAKTPSSKTANA